MYVAECGRVDIGGGVRVVGVDSELDYRLVLKDRDTEEGNVRKMGKELVGGGGSFYGQEKG